MKETPFLKTKLSRAMGTGPADELNSALSDAFDGDDCSIVKLETPPLLSSTRTSSTASSPGEFDGVWDSPLPSSYEFNSTHSNVTLTPLTPPSVHRGSSDPSPVPQRHEALFKKSTEGSAGGDTPWILYASHGTGTDLHIGATEDKDYFPKPQKLIRNLTAQLQASESL